MAKTKASRASKPVVGVVLGSDSDLRAVERCLTQLAALGIAYEVRVISAHRTPDAAHEYAATAARRGLKVIIAAAGMSAALGGVLAAKTTLPVIGVPLAAGPLAGLDAALSTMQMPAGVPVACMAIGPAGAVNAAIFAAEILAVCDGAVAGKLKRMKLAQARKVAAKDAAVRNCRR
jgi:phosphoribosylaminoimidazole carboxylase PurE protein